MTVVEIIEQQRKKCEADKQARLNRTHSIKPVAPQPAPKKMTALERERAFVEDRTYDGKPPEGGMRRIIRKESPEEYVARDGTRTFVPWRYVSMQDIELPDNGNPYRKPSQDDNAKKPLDPWERPSGYVGSAAGSGMSPEYDPWSISGDVPSSQGGQVAGCDDWNAPPPMQTPLQHVANPVQNGGWDSWLAPTHAREAPQVPAEQQSRIEPNVDANGTLDIMRNMRP